MAQRPLATVNDIVDEYVVLDLECSYQINLNIRSRPCRSRQGEVSSSCSAPGQPADRPAGHGPVTPPPRAGTGKMPRCQRCSSAVMHSRPSMNRESNRDALVANHELASLLAG